MKKRFNKTHRPAGRCVFRSAGREGKPSGVLLHFHWRSFGPTKRFQNKRTASSVDADQRGEPGSVQQVHPAHPAPACGCAHAAAPVRPVAVHPVAVAVAVAVRLCALRLAAPAPVRLRTPCLRAHATCDRGCAARGNEDEQFVFVGRGKWALAAATGSGTAAATVRCCVGPRRWCPA